MHAACYTHMSASSKCGRLHICANILHAIGVSWLIWVPAVLIARLVSDAGCWPAAGQDAPGGYVAVDPYEMMAEQVVQLNEATCAMSVLHTQLLDQNAKVCLTASTSSSVVNAMVRLAAAGGPGATTAQ